MVLEKFLGYFELKYVFLLGFREGLSTRMGAGSEEIQLHIDPMDLDDEIGGLRGQVKKLRNVCKY